MPEEKEKSYIISFLGIPLFEVKQGRFKTIEDEVEEQYERKRQEDICMFNNYSPNLKEGTLRRFANAYMNKELSSEELSNTITYGTDVYWARENGKLSKQKAMDFAYGKSDIEAKFEKKKFLQSRRMIHCSPFRKIFIKRTE